MTIASFGECWRLLWHVVASTVLVGLLLFSSASSAAPIRIDEGLVDGVEENGVRVFRGIPFAAPPIGPLRWHAPVRPSPWSGVRKAEQFSPICMQHGAYPDDSAPEPMSEDCLYLNVWVPAGALGDANLPVMVWIYGGGLQNGSASTPLYAGDELAKRGVIVVTFNYRLGALGFLAHPELTSESARKVSGNYGHFDQLAALGWVQRNIAAFGGDPDNVTVFGQSSGSISISALVASPLARGLFRRAIGQSGGLFEPLDAAPDFKLKGAEAVGAAFAERLGAPSLAALRALPAEAFIAQPFYPQTNIDGDFLRETPYETFAHRRQNDIDVLIGSNEDEGLYFMSGREIGAANISDALKSDFPPFVISLIGPKAPADDRAARAAFIAFESDMRFGWDMWAWARLHSRSKKGRTFFYRFSKTPPGEEGATHGAEMVYVFDHLKLKPLVWSEDDRRVSSVMASYWTNFAKTGDPNGAGLPEWPAFTLSRDTTLLIGDEIRSGAIPNKKDLAAIDRLYWLVRALLKFGYFIAGGAVLLMVWLLWQASRRLLRPRDMSA